MISHAVQAIASLGVAFYYSWRLTLVVLASIPATALGLSLISTNLPANVVGQEEQLLKATKLANFAGSNILSVKCFNTQDLEARRYRSTIHAAAAFYFRQARINACQIGFIRFATTSMFVQGFWYGSHLVNSGQNNAGSVITTFWSCLMATKAFEDILPYVLVLEKTQSAGRSMKSIIDSVSRGPIVSSGLEGAVQPEFCEGDIEIRNVSFAYPSRPDHPVLRDATFFFPTGEISFVVGESGSGKSSLANLLMRFYRPDSGTVRLDNNNIEDVSLDWLRNNITLVQQKSILFNETIFRNIAFGRQDHELVTLNEVKPCVELASLGDTIKELECGLNTKVGAGGAALSGGQKQRVAIARGRIRDTPILILDESTSALDYLSRTTVVQRIRTWREGKTTIIITHDYSQIHDDDFVYVLKNGHIVAEGYRRALSKDIELSSAEIDLKTPMISPNAHFDFGWGPQVANELGVSKAAQSNSPDRRDSLEQQIELQNLRIRKDAPLQRSRSIRLSRALSRQMSVRTSAMFGVPRGRPMNESRTNTPATEEVAEALKMPSRTFTVRTSRPMSMHQAAALRTMHQSQSMTEKKLPVPQFFDTSSSIRQLTLRELPHRLQPRNYSAPQRMTVHRVLMTVWPQLDTRYRIVLVIGFLAALIHAAGPPVFSYVLVQLFQTFYVKQDHSKKALTFSLAILAIAIVDGIASFAMHYLLEIAGQTWVDRLRDEAMQRLLQQEKAFFDDNKNSPSLITSALDRSAEEMRNLVGRFIGLIIVVVAMMTIAIIWSFVTCWKLTLLGMAAGPFLFAVTKSFEAVSSRWEFRTSEASDDIGAVFAETFTDIRTLRAFTLEPYFHRKYTLATSAAFSVGVKRAAFCGFFFGLSDSAVTFVTALIFWFGAYLAKSNSFSIQSVLTAFSLLLFSTANSNAVVAYIPQISSSVETAARLLHLTSLPFRSHELNGRLRLDTQDPNTLSVPIHFVNLTFYYPTRTEVPALRRLNLTIPPGRCTAIVGSSGSGKSTITSLVLGLYAPTADSAARSPSDTTPTGPVSLTISGRDIRTLHLPTLRSMIALVPQDPVLFPGTVRENVIYGLSLNSHLTTDAHIIQTTRRVGIHDFITSLPAGYDTLIGDGGLGMSGGQAQRLVIARALVRQPKLLILDEPTSALDRENAALVRRTIADLLLNTTTTTSSSSSSSSARTDHPPPQAGKTARMTVIMVTHAREMMECADHVVMLEQGSVAEEGRFKDLLRMKGPLWAMLRAGDDAGTVE